MRYHKQSSVRGEPRGEVRLKLLAVAEGKGGFLLWRGRGINSSLMTEFGDTDTYTGLDAVFSVRCGKRV